MCWQENTEILHLTATAAMSAVLLGTSGKDGIFFKKKKKKKRHFCPFRFHGLHRQRQQYHPNSTITQSFNDLLHKSIEDPGK